MVDRMVLGRLVRRVLAACALCLAFIAPAGAEPGAFAGFITYSPRDVVTSVSMAGENLGYLRETALLLAVGDSTLLRRVDSSHWAALSRLPSAWMLQIHDADEDFNCRALVDPRSGRLTIQHGVDRVGSGREADAARVATLALHYVERMRTEQGVFVGSGREEGRVGGKAPESIAWKRLIDGNLRWSQGRALHPDQDSARLAETAKAQHPFAVIVTCSDSRLPPEILFDQGIGDLFVVRTAGEVVGQLEVGSIEYAVEHLGVGFILVLGHERCGAVDATVKGGDLPPDIAAIAARIGSAVDRVRNLPGDLLDNAVRENAREVALSIGKSPLVSEAIEEGRLSIKAAYYDLDFGEVAEIKR